MYYIITNKGVMSSKSLTQLNRTLNAKIEPEEMLPLGPDMVIKMTDQDIDFVQDKFRLSRVMFGNFFRKDNSAKMFMILNLVFTFLILVMKH